MVKTRKVSDRRSLRFGRMSEIVADAERLAATGSVRATGNWTAAQSVQHVARMIQASLDGFPGRMPIWLRALGRLFRSGALNRPMRSGYRVPTAMAALAPDPDVSWSDALGALRLQVGRISDGERMRHASPLLGPLSHEEWEQLHCRHAELHFSFLHADSAAAAAGGAAAGGAAAR